MLDYAAGPPSVGQSGPDLYMGGVSLSPELEGREALQPHTAMEHVGSSNSGHSTSLASCSGGACSSPGQSRLLSVGSLSGYLYMTGHEEPPAQLSRGVMPLFPAEEELAGSWPDLSWPDSPAVVTRASSSSQLQLRLQKILAWITTASRAPAGTRHPWREGGLPVRQDSQPSCWAAPRKPQPILRSSRWI